jgi:hypothetical protein
MVSGTVEGAAVAKVDRERNPPEEVVGEAEDDGGERPGAAEEKDEPADWSENLA